MPHTNETRERYRKHSISLSTTMADLGAIVRADCVHPGFRDGAQRIIDELRRSQEAIRKSLEIGRPLEKRVQGKWIKGYLPGDDLHPSFDIRDDDRCDWRFEPVPEEPLPEVVYLVRLADGSLVPSASKWDKGCPFITPGPNSASIVQQSYPGSKVITVRLVPETPKEA